jgi:hypothetical protein
LQSKTYTPKNSKILVETSVLIAASIRVSFPEGEIKDEFYYPSIELFALIRKNLSHRLGIITQTVEQEALKTLSSAVIGTLEKNVPDKAKDFEYKSTAWNRCEENMRKLTNILLREPCDEEALMEINDEVYHMYKGLEARAMNEVQLTDQAHRDIIASSAKMRRAIFDAHFLILRRDNAQLLRLKEHHASPSDIKILAEAIHLKRRYEDSGNPQHMLLASTDSNNFVVYHSKYGPSRTVTDEIEHRYGVICDWPAEIKKRF